MIRKIEEFCKRNKIIHIGDKIVLGLSGGADSVCLFFVLLALKEKYHLTLQAVHVHHGIRGIEADQDVSFVKKLCEAHQIPCLVKYFDVLEIAKQQGNSVEEAGRSVRYKAMEQVRKELGFTKIAVAHHSGDQAETILFHLCRGSGLAGLRGMQPVSGVLIRPLLLISRQEIEVFLRERNQVWCMDSTNLENNYSRNILRNQVLPLLTERINSEAVEHIVAAGEILGEAYAYIRKEAREWADKGVVERENGELALSVEKLAFTAPVIRKEIYRILLEERGGLRDISTVHLEQIEDLFLGTVGRQADLPAKRKVVRTYHSLLFLQKESLDKWRRNKKLRDMKQVGMDDLTERARQSVDIWEENESEQNLEQVRKHDLTEKDNRTVSGGDVEQAGMCNLTEKGSQSVREWDRKQGRDDGIAIDLALGKRYLLPSGSVLSVGMPEGIRSFCEKNGIEREKIMEENPCTKCFDYDTIKGTLKLRTREVGDYLELGAGLGTKTLKKYLMEKKIPREERDRIPLIADGSHILWVIGYRISAGYKVTEATRTILQIKISGGQEDDR